MSDGDALRRMTEHAFASLRLLGLQPAVVMRIMVDARGVPVAEIQPAHSHRARSGGSERRPF